LYLPPGEETNEALALEPLKEPDLSLQQQEAGATNPLAQPLRSAAIIMNQPDKDVKVDASQLTELVNKITSSPLGSLNPAYDLNEAVHELNVQEYDAGDHGILVNETDGFVCNYGPSLKAIDYIPSNYPDQLVPLDQCGDTLIDNIKLAGDSITSKGADGQAFVDRLTERLTGSSTFSGSNLANGKDVWGGLEALFQAVKPEVGSNKTSSLGLLLDKKGTHRKSSSLYYTSREGGG